MVFSLHALLMADVTHLSCQRPCTRPLLIELSPRTRVADESTIIRCSDFPPDHLLLIIPPIAAPAAATAFPAMEPAWATVFMGPIPIMNLGAPIAANAVMRGGSCTSKFWMGGLLSTGGQKCAPH